MYKNFFSNTLSYIGEIGHDPDDSDELQLQKSLLMYSAVMIASLAFLWGSIYLAFGEPLAASIPYSYSTLSFFSIVYFARTHRYQFFISSQLLIPLVLPFLLMLTLGGFKSSSAVVLWSLTSPLGALMFVGGRQAVGWFLAFLALVAFGAFLDPYVMRTPNLPPIIITIFFVLNIGAVSTVTFVLVYHFANQKNNALKLLHAEQEKSENLLLNILPKDIANILKNDSRTIADNFGEVSILFADVVDFTTMSSRSTPIEIVNLLNEVFSYFDTLVEKYNLEKIKTIGDCYMVAAGVPKPRSDHAVALAMMAIEMNDHIRLNQFFGHSLSFRIGLNSGSVVAGVIGRKKFIYDLWGDAVNVASRMESHGVSGKIQIARGTYELIKDDFICEYQGMVKVKGKGELEVWHLLAQKEVGPEG